jgi:hypothetical protein
MTLTVEAEEEAYVETEAPNDARLFTSYRRQKLLSQNELEIMLLPREKRLGYLCNRRLLARDCAIESVSFNNIRLDLLPVRDRKTDIDVLVDWLAETDVPLNIAEAH